MLSESRIEQERVRFEKIISERHHKISILSQLGDANANKLKDEIFNFYWLAAIEAQEISTIDIDKAVSVFEDAACFETYRMVDGVKAVIEFVQQFQPKKEVTLPRFTAQTTKTQRNIDFAVNEIKSHLEQQGLVVKG